MGNIYNKQNGTGAFRLIKAARCSFNGFKVAWMQESSFRQELTLTLILVPCSFVLAQSSLHWLGLVLCLLFMLFAELINSALETLADRVTLEEDVSIKRAKDLGSAAVFTSFIAVAIIWGQALYAWVK